MSINRIEQITILKRLLIIFGSICCVWLIIGCIFIFIQTYRHCKKKMCKNFFYYNRSVQLPSSSSSLLPIIEHVPKEINFVNTDQIDDGVDDRTSISTFVWERSKTVTHDHGNFIPLCQQVSEQKPLPNLIFPNTPESPKFLCRQSALTSSNNRQRTHFYYPDYRNLSYCKSTLSLPNNHISTRVSQQLMIHGVNRSSSSSIQLHSHCQSSTYPNLNEITNVKCLSSRLSEKTSPLPTVMITDVDRLQTDIIELEHFEPSRQWNRTSSQLRLLLNDPMPQDVK